MLGPPLRGAFAAFALIFFESCKFFIVRNLTSCVANNLLPLICRQICFGRRNICTFSENVQYCKNIREYQN